MMRGGKKGLVCARGRTVDVPEKLVFVHVAGIQFPLCNFVLIRVVVFQYLLSGKVHKEIKGAYLTWSGSRISTILRNPFYKGAHVVCKTHQKGMSSNTYNIVPKEQREVTEDCHEAIIPKAEWEKVQRLIDRRTGKEREPENGKTVT